MARLTYKRGADGKMRCVKVGTVDVDVAATATVKDAVDAAMLERQKMANPLHWPADPDVDYGIKGLGAAMLCGKGYLAGKVWVKASAVYREPANASDAAVKKHGAKAPKVQNSL